MQQEMMMIILRNDVSLLVSLMQAANVLQKGGDDSAQ